MFKILSKGKSKLCAGENMAEFKKKMIILKKKGYVPVGNVIKENIFEKKIICQMTIFSFSKLVIVKSKKNKK